MHFHYRLRARRLPVRLWNAQSAAGRDGGGVLYSVRPCSDSSRHSGRPSLVRHTQSGAAWFALTARIPILALCVSLRLRTIWDREVKTGHPNRSQGERHAYRVDGVHRLSIQRDGGAQGFGTIWAVQFLQRVTTYFRSKVKRRLLSQYIRLGSGFLVAGM